MTSSKTLLVELQKLVAQAGDLRAPKKVLYPATKPDLDKLVRSVGDALKGLAYEEDSRIVDIDARKRFAIESAPRDTPPTPKRLIRIRRTINANRIVGAAPQASAILQYHD